MSRRDWIDELWSDFKTSLRVVGAITLVAWVYQSSCSPAHAAPRYAAQAIPLVAVDTVWFAGSARGMRCCCPCDAYAARVLRAGNAKTSVFTVLDTIETVQYRGADLPKFKTCDPLFMGNEVPVDHDTFFRVTAAWLGLCAMPKREDR